MGVGVSSGTRLPQRGFDAHYSSHSNIESPRDLHVTSTMSPRDKSLDSFGIGIGGGGGGGGKSMSSPRDYNNFGNNNANVKSSSFKDYREPSNASRLFVVPQVIDIT